jgi:NAD(P)-dependent dehydrogenase (short-subunit alcohol dehydrogenase family)
MAGEDFGGEVTVLRPAAAGADPGAVTAILTESFAAIRDAVGEGRPVVVVLAAADLLGQGDPLDAAAATALLGMVRTFGIEGAKPGWRVNAVAGGADDATAIDETIDLLARSTALTGQLLQVGGANLGKVPA